LMRAKAEDVEPIKTKRIAILNIMVLYNRLLCIKYQGGILEGVEWTRDTETHNYSIGFLVLLYSTRNHMLPYIMFTYVIFRRWTNILAPAFSYISRKGRWE
jgi:hypothetical protein